MALELTIDPWVVIERREPGSVFYRNVSSGERWVIRGECARCGLCCAGAEVPGVRLSGLPVGTPGAVVDAGSRPDVPMRPEAPARCPGCAMSGEYL